MDRRRFGEALAGLGICSLIPKLDGLVPFGDFAVRAAQWNLQLNCWEWPNDWGLPPQWITDKFSKQGRDCYEFEKERYKVLMDATCAMAGGRKEVLRVHNVRNREAMTDDEFERWFSESYR